MTRDWMQCITGTIGAGTVTSVGLTVPNIMSVSGSPVTTSGTLAVSLATQNANLIFAGPTSGGAATPTFRAMVTADIPVNQTLASITFVIDGGGSTITTGVKGYLEVPFACTINRSTTLADQSGSIVIDIWKDTYANFPPTDADSITASAPPTISSGTKAQDSTLTGWTVDVSAGDILGFNVDSCTSIQRVTLALKATKT